MPLRITGFGSNCRDEDFDRDERRFYGERKRAIVTCAVQPCRLTAHAAQQQQFAFCAESQATRFYSDSGMDGRSRQ